MFHFKLGYTVNCTLKKYLIKILNRIIYECFLKNLNVMWSYVFMVNLNLLCTTNVFAMFHIFQVQMHCSLFVVN